MLREMTWSELLGWQEYSALEPFGENRADLRSGFVASAIYNVNRAKQSDKIWTPSDFMPFSEGSRVADRRRPMTSLEDWERFGNDLRMIAKANKGK